MSVSGELLCSFELLKPLDSSALKSHIKKGRNKRNSMMNSPPVSALMDGSFSNRRQPYSPRHSCTPSCFSKDSMVLHGGPQKAGLFSGYNDLEAPSCEISAANSSSGVCPTPKRIKGASDSHRSSETSTGTAGSASTVVSFTEEHRTKSPDPTRVRRITDADLKARRESAPM